MDGWHHQLNVRDFEQTLGDGEGQGSLRCYSPGGHKESDMTERLNNINRALQILLAPPPQTHTEPPSPSVSIWKIITSIVIFFHKGKIKSTLKYTSQMGAENYENHEALRITHRHTHAQWPEYKNEIFINYWALGQFRICQDSQLCENTL